MSETSELLETSTDDSVQRPPRPPGPALGPYYQFITTDLKSMQWIGSALIFRHVSCARPSIEFKAQAVVTYDWEVLYENLFDMRAYRVNLSIELRRGKDDEKVDWKVDWGDYTTNGTFHIAQYDQKWRGAFFSCNGFDATISKEVALGLTYNAVWNDLLSIHEINPFHLLVWGGDQVYNDFVLEDIPFLQNWSRMEWDEKWKFTVTKEAAQEIEQYYFNNYTEHWERRPEMKLALGSVPSLMMWDDHDIFDGAGSYPQLLNDSPIMTDLFGMAQKMRLLFQHHTTPSKARQHRLFGYQGHNFLAQCGPNLVFLGTDGRSERSDQTVTHENSWNMIFEKLDNELENVQHLIVLLAVPFSFPRFRVAESLLDTWKKIAMRWRNIPFSQQTNSVFGLPELYDDLLDEWTHDAHIEERNRILARLQEFAEKKRTRVTLFSGDVHCCGVGRFRTQRGAPPPLHDSKLIYQIISSAIVNSPPPRIVIRAAHLFSTTWYPIVKTEEALIEFFDQAPEYGAKLFLRKLLPNRNWCYFEQCETMDWTPQDSVANSGFLDSYFWPIVDYLLLLIGLSRIVSWKNKRTKKKVALNKKSKLSSASRSQNQPKPEINNLKVQFWLENTEKSHDVVPFSNYDLFIPDLQ
ncbi:unnamed protein product [Rotaria magnacalcarata]|uniref:PhoD-like phosphatase domain-containing protein n=4 Tax=Rotaria magnacalcarata TaxID=392030 RepID=A0A816WXN0_9BILA|nr:unnamed protein product [Rotaria magnacalcarata]CAF2185797.1 unnamed protein product [Rotaria magnacalcarata]CAF4167028.1 unnamed protein product [Rotaria magnacalcarata]